MASPYAQHEGQMHSQFPPATYGSRPVYIEPPRPHRATLHPQFPPPVKSFYHQMQQAQPSHDTSDPLPPPPRRMFTTCDDMDATPLWLGASLLWVTQVPAPPQQQQQHSK